MKISATILQPTWDKATTAKVYQLDSNKKPETIGTYNLGKQFKFKVFEVEGLLGLRDLIAKCANSKAIRIAGTPAPQLHGVVSRKKENFLDAGTQILLLDADDWPVPKGKDLLTVEHIGDTVRQIVSEMGLTFLDGVQFCVLLSSSQWNPAKLRAHIYYLIDKPIKLEALHQWGFNYNSFNPKYKIDYSLFRQVQPDFVSKRICQGFRDPLPDTLRLTVHCDALTEYVSRADLMEHIEATANKVAAYQPVGTSTTSVVTPILNSWENTLTLCGTAQHGINDPAFRACAQMVQELGNSVVEKNLQYYTNKVFLAVWDSIEKHGVRGDKKDRTYYDRQRFKGYITTALQKNFGEATDSRTKNVVSALQSVKNGGSISLLFDKDIVDDCRFLKANNPGKWAGIRATVKKELKGKLTISELDNVIKDSTAGKDTAQMIEEIIQSFEWIEGSLDKGMYCKVKKGTNYSVVGIDEGVDSEIYCKALELFSDNIPMNFEKNVLKVLVARSRSPIDNPFKETPVENRAYTNLLDGKNTCYYNLGVSAIGDQRTAVITETGVDVIPSSLAPITWHAPKQSQSAEIDSLETWIGELGEDEAVERLITKYLLGMKDYTSIGDIDSYIDLVAWQTTSVVNTGTSTILELTGASGDGKSSTALFSKELVDPTSSSLRDAPDLHNGLYQKQELAKVLRSRHITIIDNMSNLTPAEQDLLCSVATGWKYDLRILYTQTYLNLVIKRPIILTALGPVITNQDLRSRSVSIPVSRKAKVQKGDIYANWDRDKPTLLLGFLLFLSQVIARVNKKRADGENLNSRDLWGEAARHVAMQKLGIGQTEIEREEKIISGKARRDIEEALMNSRGSMILAWITESSLFKGQTVVEMATPNLYSDLSKFINENAGTTIKVLGNDVDIIPKFAPNTARGFGMTLSKILNDIPLVTGWEVAPYRTSTERGYRFTLDLDKLGLTEEDEDDWLSELD